MQEFCQYGFKLGKVEFFGNLTGGVFSVVDIYESFLYLLKRNGRKSYVDSQREI